MKQVLITDASDAELRSFANDTLGLNLPPNTKTDTLRGKIRLAWDKDFVLTDDDPVDAPTQEGDAPVPITESQALPKEGYRRIILQETDDSDGMEPVPVGVNGKIMLVPRGKEVDIPEAYYHVLCNAITHKFDALPDGGINPDPRKVPLYPFQLVA